MLIETLEYAVDNRELILSAIKPEEHESIIKRAKDTWVEFEPEASEERRLVGIDSSWNSIPYQGFYIYAVDAVAVLGNGKYLVKPSFEVGLGTLAVRSGEDYFSSPELALESKGMEYEFEQAKSCLGSADCVLVDGSILARYYDRKQHKEGSFYDRAKELMAQEGLLYVSKKSYSNAALHGTLGDMFYYNRMSFDPGFSSPHIDRTGVSVSYVRLARDSPCIRIEVPGRVGSSDIQRIMSLLKGSSVDGYPYVLRLAHESGKISHDEMLSLANLLGLEAELGGRQVLGE